MATGAEVETLTGELARETPKRDRAQVLSGLTAVGTALSNLVANKTLLDTVVSDANTASQNEYGLEQVQSDWASNLQTIVASSFSYSAKTGINALAQLIADLSEQAGLEGGANELRLYKNGVVVAVDQDA